MNIELKLERPLVAFDLETTGTDVGTDRIVALAAFRFESPTAPGADPGVTRHAWLLNPTVPISAAATRMHGITNEQVKDCPTFDAVAEAVRDVFAGADLLGYNIRNFDVPLLWEELFRAGIKWDLTGARVIDPCVIFKRKEPRDLTAAVRKFDGGEHKEAHDATADALAAVAVLIGQRKHYHDVAGMDVAALAEFSANDEMDGEPVRRLDLAGHIVKTKDGVARFTAKKVRGKAVLDDEGYANWMLRNDFPQRTKQVIEWILRNRR